MTVAKPQTISVIDSISAGYAALNRRLWVVLIPIAVNLFFVFGPPVSARPLWEQVRGLLTTVEQMAAQNNSAAPTTLRLNESLDHLDMRQPLLWLNFLPLLERNVLTAEVEASGITSIGADLSLAQQAIGSGLTLGSAASLLLLILGLNLGGLLLSGLFLHEVARAVLRDDVAGAGGVLAQWAQLVGRIALWVLVLCAAAIVIGLPFLFIATLLALFLPQASALLVLLWTIGIFWVRIYIGFAVESMALDRVGPLRAIASSFQGVRRNFFPTLGFLILLGVIGVGLGLVWQQISTSTIGLLFACAASAYIGTGLEAARMIFYRERLRGTASLARTY